MVNKGVPYSAITIIIMMLILVSTVTTAVFVQAKFIHHLKTITAIVATAVAFCC